MWGSRLAAAIPALVMTLAVVSLSACGGGGGAEPDWVDTSDDNEASNASYDQYIPPRWPKCEAPLEAASQRQPVVLSNPEDSSPETDRMALETLYEVTDGPGWENSANWMTDAPLGEWHGVGTGGYNNRVVTLDLENNGLYGVIPPEVGNLAFLEELNLSRNRGAREGTGELYSLCGEIPAEVGNLSRLRVLDMEANALEGEIPAEVWELTELEHLNLRQTGMTGRIPPQIGNLSELEYLNLDNNYLEGEIPPEVWTLRELRTLDLGWNRLTGEIPPDVGNLYNLGGLYLAGNRLEGEVPIELETELNLSGVQLGGNRLSGCYPESPRSGLAIGSDIGDEDSVPWCFKMEDCVWNGKLCE